MDPLRPFAVASSLLSTSLRGGAGIQARPAGERPPLLFELWEFEACPYCRLVREALTELDLDATIYPCPKGGERFRPQVVADGGKAQFPWFHDPNTGTRLYESLDIIRYLYATYGGELPLHWRFGELQSLGSSLAGVPRAGNGRTARPSRAPQQPLELWSFEGSPFARLVRERLCELELPYVLRSAGRTRLADWLPPQVRNRMLPDDSPQTLNRQVLLQRAGSVTIPWLHDPNTGTGLGDSAAINAYLEDTYAVT